MSRTIQVSVRASADADTIYEWIAERSPVGATHWYQAFLDALHPLQHQAESYTLAPEAKRLGVDLRQALFKTRKGRTYRALFLITADIVHIVSVRGAGQDLATADEIEFPEGLGQ